MTLWSYLFDGSSSADTTKPDASSNDVCEACRQNGKEDGIKIGERNTMREARLWCVIFTVVALCLYAVVHVMVRKFQRAFVSRVEDRLLAVVERRIDSIPSLIRPGDWAVACIKVLSSLLVVAVAGTLFLRLFPVVELSDGWVICRILDDIWTTLGPVIKAKVYTEIGAYVIGFLNLIGLATLAASNLGLLPVGTRAQTPALPRGSVRPQQTQPRSGSPVEWEESEEAIEAEMLKMRNAAIAAAKNGAQAEGQTDSSGLYRNDAPVRLQ